MPVLVNTQSGLAENLPQDQADAALAAGSHEVPLYDKDGNPVTASLAEAQKAIQEGYYEPTQKQLEDRLKTAKFSSTPETIKAGVEAAGRGVAGPAFTAAERAVGVDPENIYQRQKAHPTLAPVVEGATFLGSALVGIPSEAKFLSEMGAGVKGLTGVTEGSGLAAKAAAGALGLGSEFAAFQAGDEGSKFLMNDPDQTMGSALSSIGYAGAIGGVGGAAFGSVSPLWKMTAGPKVAQMLEDFSSRLKFRAQTPDLVGSIAGQLGDFYESVSSLNKRVWGDNGIKMKLAQEMLPGETSGAMLKQADEIKGALSRRIEAMKGNREFTEKHVAQLQDELNTLNAATDVKVDPISLEKTVPKPIEIFDALNESKQKLDELAKWDQTRPKAFMKEMGSAAHDIRGDLENSSVWGDAADLQKSINKGFKKWIDNSHGAGSFESRFMSYGPDGERVVDRGKIASFLRASEDSADVKKAVLKSTLEAGNGYKQAVHDAFGKLGLESPVQSAATHHVQEIVGQKSLGQKAADYIYDKGLNKIIGGGLGTGTGAGLGALLGHPAVGAIIGERALTPFFSSVLPAITKPLMEKAANVEAFKSASALGVAALKAEQVLTSGVKALFNSGSHTLSEAHAMNASERNKLKEALARVEKDPSHLLSVGGQSGYYVPDHATALAKTVAQGTQYLNSLKPKEVKTSPLDKAAPVPASQERMYDRALDVAQSPILTIKALKDGTLTAEDMKTIKATNPGWHQLASQKIFSEMTSAVAQGKTIPMQQRIGLSLFLGEPVDTNLTPSVVMSNQQILNAPSLSQQSMPKEGRKTAPLGPMKNIQLASRTATRTQEKDED